MLSAFLLKKRIFLFLFSFYLIQFFGKKLQCVVFSKYQLECQFSDPTDLVFLITQLKHNLMFQFTSLSELTVVDFPQYKKRFKLTYHFLSPQFNQRLTLACFLSENKGIASVCNVFFGTNWQEREVWDLFGIHFINHPDLRWILTDYGFRGFPLWKDFPLTGFFETVYDDWKKQIIYTPVSLAQEYRTFAMLNPWTTTR